MNNVKARVISISVLAVLICCSLFTVDYFEGKRLDIDTNIDTVTDLSKTMVDETADEAAADSEFIVMADKKKTGDEIVFSHTDYFYKSTVSLKLTTENKDITEIYYTLDSKSPVSSTSRKLYSKAINLSSTSSEQPKSHVVKVCGKKADGTYTKVYTHSYFIGEKIDKRFNTLVFSLSTDPDYLYDYNNGIFVAGKLRDDYIKESGNKNPDPPEPANYNMRGKESERPVYVEVLDEKGNQLISQNAGMRTFGGWSRAMEQKSIKLYARKEYDPDKNKFDYNFFEDETDYNGLSVTSYKRIVLRNSANDNPYAFQRDETIQAMADGTYLQDTQGCRAAAVFLNGEYYGFVWVKEVYDDNYLDEMNGIKDGEWAILGGGEHYKSEDEDDPLNKNAITDYEKMYAYSEKDLKNNTTFEELKKLMDVDNFLSYYAVQIYANNGDWPGGNYKVYKYYGKKNPSAYADNTSDGKWRWLLYDTDFGFGLYDSRASEKTLGVLLGQHGNDENKKSDLLIALLARNDMKEKFVGIMCDLMNYHYSPENVKATAKKFESIREMEVAYNFKYGGAQLKRTWSNINNTYNEVNKIISFGEKRPEEMKKQIEKFLNVKETGYTLTAAKNKNAVIKVNSCTIDESTKDFSGFYYDINKVSVSAEVEVGYAFSHWMVNGVKNTTKNLTITKANASNGKVDIKLVTEKSDKAKPVIKMIDYEGDKDYLQITNPYSKEIDLRKYYISDDKDNLFKQVLADRTLKSGETINIYCKNYSAVDALGGSYLGFNLKNSETLYITGKDKATAENITMPKIKNDFVLVKDMKTGKFYDVKRSEYKG